MEEADDEALQKSRDEFADFVIGLENKLDQAEEYGRAGDMRMLGVLNELSDIKTDLEALARSAHEELPSRDYHAEVTKIIREYIAGIIEREYEAIGLFIRENPEAKQDATVRANQLLHIISFYGDLYPELDLGVWKEKVEELL